MTTTESTLAAAHAAADRLGTVGRLDDGRHYVIFERHLPYPVETVWAAITQPEQLAKWFPGIKLELVQDGRFEIWFDGESCDGPAHVSGTVTRYEPPRVLECGSLRFELEDRGADCLLTFTDILHYDGKRSRTEFANSVLGGWHRFLDALETALGGGKVDHHAAELDYQALDVPGRP